MHKIITYLAKLNLSDGEARLYLKLLSLGTTTISDLARNMGMKRTTVYLYIDSLIEKGLVTRTVRETKKFIIPTNPEELGILIEKKAHQLQTIKEEFPHMLKTIKAIYPGAEEAKDIEIRIYKGKQSARRIYLESFEADELRAYVQINEDDKLFPENLPVFEDAFKKNKKLRVWEIVYGPSSTTRDAELVQNMQTDRYSYKFIPKSLKLTSQDILIYDNKVAIIDYRPGGTNIVLHSTDFYNNFKELFEFMWGSLPNPYPAGK